LAAFGAKEYLFKTLILIILIRKINKISVLNKFTGLCKKYSAAFGGERKYCWRRKPPNEKPGAFYTTSGQIRSFCYETVTLKKEPFAGLAGKGFF
jgi:hypothetical protein